MFPSAFPFQSQSQSPFQGLNAFQGFPGFGDASSGQGNSDSSVPAAASIQIRAKSFQLFERVVSVEQAKAGFGPVGPQTPLALDNQNLSAEEAANNILSFISQKLQSDAAQGADRDALEDRLEQGLAGFKQGFEQARKDLDALGLLTPELQADIQDTYDRVLEGVDKLSGQLDDLASGRTLTEPRAEDSKQQAPLAGAQSVYERYDFRQSNSFRFNLTTADGDTVSIRLKQRESFSAEYGQVQQGGYEASMGRYDHRFDSRFKLDVEGHLDDAEMTAIADLMGQVGELSEQFFAGDLGAALQQAQSLGYDASEISSFSLNLRQTTVQRMQSAYSTVADSAPVAAPVVSSAPGDSRVALPVSDLLDPMGRFVEQLNNATERANERFSAVNDLVRDIAEIFDEPGKNAEQLSFRDFIGQLLDTL